MRAGVFVVALSLTLAACNLSADVNNTGGYTFLPGAPAPDTAALPLRHLVIVERDAGSEHTLVYYFEGNLGAAGLGLEDLRRSALRHGGFQLRFAYRPSSYATALDPIDEGAIAANLDDHRLVLSQLDTEGLYLTGASRFLRSVDEAEFPVRAYFGATELASNLGTLRLDVEGGEIVYGFVLETSEVAPHVTNDAIGVEHLETPRAGELEVELSQSVVRISDGAALETSVVSLLAPDAAYTAPATVVLGAFSGNCWSIERPLITRVGQIRQYYEPRDGGDFAVIERRRDAAALSADELAEFIDENGGAPALAAYCDDIE
jgi:hypothetical protein